MPAALGREAARELPRPTLPPCYPPPFPWAAAGGSWAYGDRLDGGLWCPAVDRWPVSTGLCWPQSSSLRTCPWSLDVPACVSAVSVVSLSLGVDLGVCPQCPSVSPGSVAWSGQCLLPWAGWWEAEIPHLSWNLGLRGECSGAWRVTPRTSWEGESPGEERRGGLAWSRAPTHLARLPRLCLHCRVFLRNVLRTPVGSTLETATLDPSPSPTRPALPPDSFSPRQRRCPPAFHFLRPLPDGEPVQRQSPHLQLCQMLFFLRGLGGGGAVCN